MKALNLLGAALAHSVVSSAWGVLPRSDNPFQGMNQFVNPEYADRANISAQIFIHTGETELAAKATQIQINNPTWTWIDNAYKVPKITEYLQIIVDSGRTDVIGTFVIYNLPDRECGTTKPRNELANNADGEARYKAFIDDIRAALSSFSVIPRVAFIIEPAAITNLLAFKVSTDCIAADPVYRDLITYAITSLALPNVALYLDGGDSSMLGWDDTISAAAKAFTDIYKNAGNPQNLRGLSVNVGKYNAWSDNSCETTSFGNKNCDEKRYINSLAPLLIGMGWGDPHFIIDQSRSGVQPSPQSSFENTCNIAGAGFGNPPGAGTNDPLADSFVWVKPGGVSDGTNDQNSPNFDPNCDSEDALKPGPEYGRWYVDYFRDLIINASPPIVPT